MRGPLWYIPEWATNVALAGQTQSAGIYQNAVDSVD